MAKKVRPAGRKHVPMRTCIVCRQNMPKRSLIRVVRTPEGQVVIDPTGKLSGRGAYLCRKAACWEQALKKKHLERALQTTLDEKQRAELTEFGRTMARDRDESVQCADGEGVTPA